MNSTPLPIEPLIPEIVSALVYGPNLVLEAPPGAGKTTRVPIALLDCVKGKIIVLEPRRLAARTAAERVARMLGEKTGERCGYRVRLDRKVSAATRIEFVTTGLFLRQIQADPELSGVGAVVFDEFHERSLESDLALALALETQGALRDDLKLLVMSATLDGERVKALLPGAKLLTSKGRAFPVAVSYEGGEGRIEDRVISALKAAMLREGGDVLVFLPGLGEIRRAETLLQGSPHLVCPLHGDLPLSEQDRAITPDAGGRRKIVLATSIAETSLTIEGVRIVIDSGLKRAPRFDPASGMTRLATVKVSAASSEQRKGRAGRLAPGICVRLWTEPQQLGLLPFDPPEILEADLAPFALELAQWGISDPTGLPLLDQPPAGAFEQAVTLLQQLDALDAQGKITAHGRQMAGLGTHPRLAHMMIRARDMGAGALAANIAALIGERDMLKGPPDARDADLQNRLELLKGREAAPAGLTLDRGVRERVRQSARQFRDELEVKPGDEDISLAGRIVALAYPDRLAQQRGGSGRFRLAGGGSAILPPHAPLAREPWLAIAAMDGAARDARIFLAAHISLADIEVDFAPHIENIAEVVWDAREDAVKARAVRRLWSLVLADKPLEKPDPQKVTTALIAGIRGLGLHALPFDKDSNALRNRIEFCRHHDAQGGWPDCSDDGLLAGLEDWLSPFLTGMTRRAHLDKLDLAAALKAQLDWGQQQALDRFAPSHIAVPSGSRIAIDYSEPETPVLAVRLQELFGLAATPTIANSAVLLTLHLLSPARRPLQVTRDLSSFWANTYKAVKADMKGQYPKHYWPDDPMQAEPTARAKPRGT